MANDLKAALERILEEPKNTMSDGKALKAIVRIAKDALASHTGEAEPTIAARGQSPDDELLVACITLNGATLTVEPHQMAEMFGTDDEQHAYELTFKRMTRAAYEALGDFYGF